MAAKKAAAGLAAITVVLACMTAGAGAAGGIFVVVNTNDSGPGSLRAALDFANSDPGPDTISFAIPPTDPGFNGQWFTIRPESQLPPLADGTTLDAATQTAATGDTNAAGPEVELRGDLAPGAAGVTVWSSDARVEGLAVNSFAGGAIQIHGSRDVVAHNYVGTDATGVVTGNVGTGISVCCTASPDNNQIVDNLVRGNRPGMIIQADRTIVRGNRVELSGPQPAPPGCGQGGGIFVNGVDNVVGGPAPGDRNVVSLNGNGGILLEGGSGTVVQGNYVGTDPSGNVAAGNRCVGIVLEGSLTTNARIIDNLVSGNEQFGIAVGQGDGTAIAGNRIGTNADGSAALGNSAGGIIVVSSNTTIGGPNLGDGNVISGNHGSGVSLQGSGASLRGNYIGTNADGTAAVPNEAFGVLVGGSGNTIGGTSAADRNVISGNGGPGAKPWEANGVSFADSSSGNTVEGNYIGTNATGTAALPNRIGVGLGGTGNRIGGTTAAERNVISGNTDLGLCCGGDGNVIEGNYIGTNAAGTAAVGNGTVGNENQGECGIALDTGGNNNTIARNLISGNNGCGIGLAQYPTSGATGNVIQGNLIGTDASGMAAIPNTFVGVRGPGFRNNTIGGPTAADRNVISGNLGAGIGGGGTDNLIEGNYIGTTIDGAGALGNGGAGVGLGGAVNDVIRGNVISGNTGPGVRLTAFPGAPSSGNTITGNLVGTNAGGTAALPNQFGIVLIGNFGAVSSNTIGGTSASARNVVSGNTGHGFLLVGLATTQNTIRGNYIGVGADGSTPLGNGDSGVEFVSQTSDGPNDNLVAANTIAYNQTGVLVGSGVRDTISRNSIFANLGLGIDLSGDGVTPNDPGDADTGPNELMNFPVLVNAVATPGQTVVVGQIDTPSPSTVVIEFFASTAGDPTGYGEGETFLGTVTPNANGRFVATLPPVPRGTIVTATATNAAGSTSEFSADVVARGPGAR